MVVVSIIVPIYRGNQYISGLIDMIDANTKNIDEKLRLELVLVNDYPEIPLMLSSDIGEKYNFDIKVHTNERNEGIHRSRVNGLNISLGKYVVMLDQDDVITPDFIKSQLEAIGDMDASIGNGYKLIGKKKRKIYRNLKKQKLAINENIFLRGANQIVSPGHVMIKKKAVPQEWRRYIIKENGADDLFLWLLMFESQCRFTINTNFIYTHVDTGVNVSADLHKMLKSSDDVIEKARKNSIIPEKKIKILERRIKFLRGLQNQNFLKKMWICFTNLDICIYKLYAYYR